MTNDIIVVGHPKSGNTWLSRLLADALDSRLVGLPPRAVPIGEEGLSRPGLYTVRQLHLVPIYDDDCTEAINGPYTFAVKKWTDERIVLIMRDPRDVAVSCMFYWEIQSLATTIEAMHTRGWPIAIPLTWADFNRAWIKLDVPVIRYEQLLNDTLTTLTLLLGHWQIDPVHDLAAVIERQSFATRRKQFEEMKHYSPYGTGIQLKNMRKGAAGDWVNHFHKNTAAMFHTYFFEAMKEFNYEQDPKWWTHLPE